LANESSNKEDIFSESKDEIESALVSPRSSPSKRILGDFLSPPGIASKVVVLGFFLGGGGYEEQKNLPHINQDHMREWR
jgi:hypothetical protein